MKIVSLLLARGGSKGIPKKNIVSVRGHPLLKYTIDAALSSRAHETWVSTDSSEIKKIALALGSRVLVRPDNISLDSSSSEEAILHFCESVAFDVLIFIQPTSPLLLSRDIDRGLDLFFNKDKKYDSVFSGYREHWVPRWSLDLSPLGWAPEKRPRRQEVDECWVENGAFYISSKKSIVLSKLRYSGNVGCVEMPIHRSFQVDTFGDLKLIKSLL